MANISLKSIKYLLRMDLGSLFGYLLYLLYFKNDQVTLTANCRSVNFILNSDLVMLTRIRICSKECINTETSHINCDLN
jgi:hypothetical protein